MRFLLTDAISVPYDGSIFHFCCCLVLSFFFLFLILLFVSCRDEYQPLVILTQFRVTDGTCLKNQKLNTLLQSTWTFECHFNAAQETKKATYECTELKYVETKCLFSESQRHAVSLLEVFISNKSEIVICEVSFLIFFLAFYHQRACISRVLRTAVNCAVPGYGTCLETHK